jgi:hypothetical protein
MVLGDPVEDARVELGGGKDLLDDPHELALVGRGIEGVLVSAEMGIGHWAG